MADYWKSNPRYYCEVCKCWFGDNKISLEFHQNGRRHKANVERQLRETRKRAAVKEKEDIKLSQTLEQIEKAALASFQRDQQGLPPTKRVAMGTGISLTPEMIQFEQQNIKKEMAQKLEVRKKEIEQEEEEQKRLTINSTAASSPWQQLTSPEGYPYYYNSITGVSQWEPPEGLSPPTEQAPPTQSVEKGIKTEDSSPDGDDLNVSENRTEYNNTLAESSKDVTTVKTDSEDKSSTLPSASPYGAWTTVSVRERNVVKEEENRDEADNDHHSDEGNPSDEEETNFKEKTTPTTSGFTNIKVEPGSFKGFSFKKRSNRSNIKERTTQW